MNISFYRQLDSLMLTYSPDGGSQNIYKALNKQDHYIIKRCFSVTQNDLTSDSDPDDLDSITFRIAPLVNDFFFFSHKLLGTKHNFYIHKMIDIKPKMFIAYTGISILKRIDAYVTLDVYIGPDDLPEVNFPSAEFDLLIKSFPNTTETQKYAATRITAILNNYFDGLGRVEEDYQKYLNKKTLPQPSLLQQTLMPKQKEILEAVLSTLEKMLDLEAKYSEADWQAVINDVIKIINPKYIFSKREAIIGSDGRHNKKPDFLLVDVNGFVDILEIKTPYNIRLISNSEYRNNYIADRDLSGALVQIEKYIYTLRTNSASVHRVVSELQSNAPNDIKVKIINPQGYLIMGRSIHLTPDQKDDFEIIKRQYKNVIDIITYDDLIARLKNIITALG